MRCFNHPDIDAIGNCKACHKGLCTNCANDLGHGLACKGVHEKMVETYNTIVERNAQVYGAMPKNSLLAPIFYGFMGVLFLGFGLLRDEEISSLPTVMGAGFLVFAIFVYRANRKAFGARSS